MKLLRALPILLLATIFTATSVQYAEAKCATCSKTAGKAKGKGKKAKSKKVKGKKSIASTATPPKGTIPSTGIPEKRLNR